MLIVIDTLTSSDFPPISLFSDVIRCARCSNAQCSRLLRDDAENVPQPGYVGANYRSTRLLLVGQNPGVGTVGLEVPNRIYTAALRSLGQHPDHATFSVLAEVLENFVPTWPVHGSYFPLAECGLSLQDIASAGPAAPLPAPPIPVLKSPDPGGPSLGASAAPLRRSSVSNSRDRRARAP